MDPEISTIQPSGSQAGDDSVVIGVAQRILMQLHGYTAVQAGRELKDVARDLNMHVAAVASAVVAMHLDNARPADLN